MNRPLSKLSLSFSSLCLTLCLATTPVLSQQSDAHVAGFAPLSIAMPHHGRSATGGIWYPTHDDHLPLTQVENPVFFGSPVREGATLANGTFPLVLLSHGLGAHIQSLSWLAAGLAQRGAIVLALNHPNSTARDFNMLAGLEHGTRVLDIQVAIDEMIADPRFADHLDLSQIMVAGFSYGGWTALSMGGVTADLAGFIDHCSEYGDRSSHCADIAQSGIDLGALDAEAWNQSYKDERITAVVAIDPGLIYNLPQSNVQNLIEQVMLIGLGEGDDRLLATDFSPSGSDFVAQVPQADVLTLSPANHFSAVLVCKPEGAAILLEETDYRVCDEPEGGNRADIHAAILEEVAAQLGL